MAESEDIRYCELLSVELNKLNIKCSVDILATINMPKEVTSDILKKFFKELFVCDANNVISENVFEDAVGDFNDNENCATYNVLIRLLGNEINTFKTLNRHSESRISDKCEIITLIKTNNNISGNHNTKVSIFVNVSNKDKKSRNKKGQSATPVYNNQRLIKLANSTANVNKQFEY
ncbi:hypothetical protein HHI36_002708 [Cryptolaemus montrouzieri]|uniref:Uncharacterized protein n=1 Tax=Cryptolaemus montrouzieri TaxID=559131 RepID=A0ABD2PB90_9CUCU